MIPLGFGPRAAAPVAEQERAQPAAGPLEVPPRIFAGADQIARRFVSLTRHMDRGERAGPGKHRQLGGIATIGLDAIAGPAGNQAGGDNLTRDPAGLQIPIEFEATRAGFVTAAHWSLATHFVHEAAQMCQIGREWLRARRAHVRR